MSMPIRLTRTCAVCGGESEQIGLASTNTFGGTPDLDLRPPEMMRSTMAWWLQECPHCGYIAPDLKDEPIITEEFLQNERYTLCDGLNFANLLTKRFYRYHLTNIAAGDNEGAYAAALRAAWCCDDYRDKENAKHCRLLALEYLEKVIQKGSVPDELFLVKADLLRRSGRFDQLIAEFEGRNFSNDTLNSIAAFQVERAKQSDTACYRVQDVKTDEN